MNRNDLVSSLFASDYDKYVQKARNRVGDYAEDCVQEAFCRAMKYFNAFNPHKASFANWFSTILNNCINDQQRVMRLGGASEEATDDNVEPIEDLGVDIRTVSEVHELINSKKGLYYDILDLHFIKGYKPLEIKEVLGANIHTIRIYLSNFNKEVRELYE